MSHRTRIIIADDHPLVRGALKQALAGAAENSDIVECGSLQDVSAALAGQTTDLILLDLTMPGVSGFSGLLYMRAQHPEIPVVVVSANEEHDTIRRSIKLGASGFIPKTTQVETMRDAIALVLQGETWVPADVNMNAKDDSSTTDIMQRLASLTPQQVRVLMMLSEGLLNKQIAYELSVSEATIKAHVSAILQKLGVDSRTQAVIAASKIETAQRSDATGA
ncbi:MAG: response regulator transcription factor [Hyphomicrobiales bacterium]|nr:response regulator transcription factor [Hyphomicrobiales bacterium]